MAIGFVAALLLPFPFAALCTLIFRFPYPLVEEYLRGFTEIPLALIAVAFYMFGGGWIVMGVAGVASGFVATSLRRDDTTGAQRLTIWLAAVCAAAGVFTLAILEYIIGPW